MDNFDEFYEASLTGWATRYSDNYMSKVNPLGIVSYLNRALVITARVCVSDSSGHLDKRDEPERLLYSPEIEGDKCNLGFFDTFEEAKSVVENEILRRGGSSDKLADARKQGALEFADRVLAKMVEKTKVLNLDWDSFELDIRKLRAEIEGEK